MQDSSALQWASMSRWMFPLNVLYRALKLLSCHYLSDGYSIEYFCINSSVHSRNESGTWNQSLQSPKLRFRVSEEFIFCTSPYSLSLFLLELILTSPQRYQAWITTKSAALNPGRASPRDDIFSHPVQSELCWPSLPQCLFNTHSPWC